MLTILYWLWMIGVVTNSCVIVYLLYKGSLQRISDKYPDMPGYLKTVNWIFVALLGPLVWVIGYFLKGR